MKRRIIWGLLTCLIVTSLVLASCNKTTTSTSTPTQTTSTTTTTKTTTTTTTNTTTPTTTTATTTPVTGNWWNSLGTPQYGGTFTYRAAADTQGWDVYVANSNAPWDIFQETMGGMNWLVSPDQWSYQGKWAPDDIKAGDLVTSWEISGDLTTYTFHLRQGVHFALDPNSAASQLVNGRELIAADIAYSFDRMLGLAGYKASPWKNSGLPSIVSATATDKYTVVFTFSVGSPWYFDALMDPMGANAIFPQEIISKYGDMNNWHNVVGTGAYTLQDYVAGSSGTWVKNPNYWGYDERYPQNRLPYIDTIKYLVIPDNNTALAGLRTGKIDVLEGQGWATAATIAKSNPELLQVTRPMAGYNLSYRDDKPPFNDVRVRQAMQEAIDIPTIAATYYNKTVAPEPVGVITTAWTGWMVPYAQWPQALKDEYTYNPTAAKALLAAAGYPNGFSTNVIAPTNYDLDYLQIYKAYFAAIGINMTIKTTDPTSWLNILIAGSQDQILYNQVDGMLNPPSRLIQRFYSKAPAATNPSLYGDPAFDTIFNNFMVATDLAKQKALLQQSDLYNISNFIQMNSVPLVEYIIYQPWFKGYTGQVFYYWAKVSFARYWIDQPLKKSMGY